MLQVCGSRGRGGAWGVGVVTTPRRRRRPAVAALVGRSCETSGAQGDAHKRHRCPCPSPICAGRPEVCFAEGPPAGPGGPCAASVALHIAMESQSARALRFQQGARVACLTAGADGTMWPRRWSAGTVLTTSYKPEYMPRAKLFNAFLDMGLLASSGSSIVRRSEDGQGS